MSGPAPGPESRRARDAILGRLRTATITNPKQAPDVAAFFASRAVKLAADPATRVARFTKNMQNWRGEVIETTPERWTDTLAEIVAAKKLQHVLAGRDTWIAPQLTTTLPAEQLEWFDESLETFKLKLFERYDAGISTTLGAIAETGTLVLWPTIAEPRTLSLVPPLYIAVLHASHIVESFHDAISGKLGGPAWATSMPTNALLVTGPSKSSDIQRVLAFGVHGPREVVVILIRDDLGASQSAGSASSEVQS